MKTVTGKKFRLPGLGRVMRGFSGNGLGTFSSDCLHPGRIAPTPVPTRLRRVAHSNGFAIRLGACAAVECGNPLPPTGNPS